MHLNKTGTGKLAVNFIKKNIKSFKRQWQVTGSFFDKYFNFCPNSVTYSLGKQRNENLDKSRSEQKKVSSPCDLSHEKGLDKLNVARSRNPNRILIAHLNINSLRSKFEIFKETTGNIGGIILYIIEGIPLKSLTEIKLDNEIDNIFIKISLSSNKMANFWF